MTPEKRFCLIGHHLQGSLSPALMEAAYHGRYAYDLVDEDNFEMAFALAMEYDAFNVTAPFKEKAFSMAYGHDRNSMGANACNIMMPIHVFGEKLYMSYNSDVDGVAAALLESGVPYRAGDDSSALVVGTGGAAAAAHVALVKYLDRFTAIAGRNMEKAQLLSSFFVPDLDGTDTRPGISYTGLDPITLDRSFLRHIDIVVYTLPGSAPVPDGLPLEEAVVLEAEYRHPRLADAPCRQYVSGKLWLLHQAISGFKIMTGEQPDESSMREVLGLPPAERKFRLPVI